MAIYPEDILPDGIETTDLAGKSVRKGTIAAFLANINLIENPEVSQEGRAAAIDVMKQLAPAVVASGLHKHATFKNELVESLLREAAMG